MAERSWYSAGVQGDQLEEGRFYAYRVNHRARGSELLKVKLLAKVGRGGKVKIRYENGPHPGLEEYVRTINLIVPWGPNRNSPRKRGLLGCRVRRRNRESCFRRSTSSSGSSA